MRTLTGRPGIKRGPRQGLAENDFGNSSNVSPYSRGRPEPQPDIAELCFRRNVRRLHQLGDRCLFEFLVEVGRERLIRTDLEQRVERYISRLDPGTLAALDANRMPPPPLRRVEDGR